MRLIVFVGFFALCIQADSSAVAAAIAKINTGLPESGTVRLPLVERWRTGGDDENDTLFGVVTWAEVDERGHIFVLDVQMRRVIEFDRSGTVVRELFRPGEGPGEIGKPNDLVLLPGGRVGAVQEFPGKVVTIDAQGEPGSYSPLPMPDGGSNIQIALTSVDARSGTTVAGGLEISYEPGYQVGRAFLAMTLANGGVRTLAESIAKRSLENYVYDEAESLPSFWWASAIGPDGSVYVAGERNRYAIDVYSPQGDHVRSFGREYAPVQRSQAEMEWNRNLVVGDVGVRERARICNTEPDISWINRGIWVDERGLIWVLPSRGVRDLPKGVFLAYDVFARDGSYAKQVLFEHEANGLRDGLFFVGGGGVLIVLNMVDAIGGYFSGGKGQSEGVGGSGAIELIYCEFDTEAVGTP